MYNVYNETVSSEFGLKSPLLLHYGLSERQAIIVHKYFLGIELDSDPGLMVAIDNWERYHAGRWRSEQHLDNCRAQMAEIELHRQELSRRRGRDVNWEAAAREWITAFAGKWRASQADCA